MKNEFEQEIALPELLLLHDAKLSRIEFCQNEQGSLFVSLYLAFYSPKNDELPSRSGVAQYEPESCLVFHQCERFTSDILGIFRSPESIDGLHVVEESGLIKAMSTTVGKKSRHYKILLSSGSKIDIITSMVTLRAV